MPKTKIEWCDYSVNPVKGLCPVGCQYCYARRMYKRFKWNPEITFHPEVFDGLENLHSGDKVFVGSTFELFGDWLHERYLHSIFNYVEFHKNLTFIFLTKQPQNLIKWSPFPDNCWVGVSLTGKEADGFAYPLVHINAKVKFLSIEPLLAHIKIGNNGVTNTLENAGINWIICGQCTPISQNTTPKIEWIQEIVEAADNAKIPVFLKNNLQSLILGKANNNWATKYIGIGDYELRQEYPK